MFGDIDLVYLYAIKEGKSVNLDTPIIAMIYEMFTKHIQTKGKANTSYNLEDFCEFLRDELDQYLRNSNLN